MSKGCVQMNVRAKFRVQEIKANASYQTGGKEQESVRLVAATDERNKSWSKWTPSGSIEMVISNPEALDQFKLGSFVYVDFTAAPDEE